MDLAKQHLDIGLYTNRREEQLAFWQGEVGLEFDHVGKLGGGIHQLRHHMNGSILKINHARDLLPNLDPSGYRRLLVARPGLGTVRNLKDPDGNSVDLVPPGHHGIVGIGIEIAVSDLAAAKAFWGGAMQFKAGDGDTVVAGDTVLNLRLNVDQRRMTRRLSAIAIPPCRSISAIWNMRAYWRVAAARATRPGPSAPPHAIPSCGTRTVIGSRFRSGRN